MLSGVRSPGTKSGPDGKPDPVQSELYAVEAHYFTESRLLQVCSDLNQNSQLLLKRGGGLLNNFTFTERNVY